MKPDAARSPDAPHVAGISFRHFKGEEDLPGMHAVWNESRVADGVDIVETLAQFALQFRNPSNFELYSDILLAEASDAVVGFARVMWSELDDGTRLYGLVNAVRPEWRPRGLRTALLIWCERRICEISSAHKAASEKFFDTWAVKGSDWDSTLLRNGYSPARHHSEMVNGNLDGALSADFPEGIAMRPPEPREFKVVWAMVREAFRDHWGYKREDWSDKRMENFLEGGTLGPQDWLVAWNGVTPVGSIMVRVNREENAAFGRLRGHLSSLAVAKAWRGRGIGSALLSAGIAKVRSKGLSEARLGVDNDNTTGALRLYQRMGFGAVKTYVTYRKVLPQP